MRVTAKTSVNTILIALLATTAAGSVSAQQADPSRPDITVTGTRLDPSTMVAGPEIKGVITARMGSRMKVTTAEGTSTIINIGEATRIKASSGIFGGGDKLSTAALLNGLPVSVKTLQAPGGAGGDLLASLVSFKNSDYKTALMIHNGTSQRFEEQTAATEALRGRVGDIDNYNIKSTTNVNFDVGKAVLSERAKADLCAAASAAEGQSSALLLVVGYTDSTGSDELNQALSERRAGSVIHYLQQACHWKPYRMLTPTGMAKADPLADNSTVEGRAQNRRVAVNIMVSKAVDGM